jgi:hypothetical protein
MSTFQKMDVALNYASCFYPVFWANATLTIFKLCVHKKNHKLCQDTMWVIWVTSNANIPDETKEKTTRPQANVWEITPDKWTWSEITKYRQWHRTHKMVSAKDTEPTNQQARYASNPCNYVTDTEPTKQQVW